jgi:Transposase DDE domain group 1
VEIGASDSSLTPVAGLVAVTEVVDRLGVVEELDAGVGPIKQRARGLSAGEFLTSLACCHLTGGDFLVALDRRRADTVGECLAPVPTPASTTAATLARRIDATRRAGIEAGIAAVTARVVDLVPAARRRRLLERPTIDIDATEVEVYGHAKAGVEFNYLGQRAARPHLASWAEAGTVLAADLLSGRTDPRAGAADLIARAVAGLPAGVQGRPGVRADTGYFAAGIAAAAVDAGCDFAVGVTRNPAAWRAVAAVAGDAWTAAVGMRDTDVAVCGYLPNGWPRGTRCLVRRVRHPASVIGADPRARRRRTIPPEQLALALDGQVEDVYAYSFVLTNLPTGTPAQVRDVERWHRGRTDIEDRIRDAKHGAALRHLPSGDADVNAAWMWGALLAINLSAWLHELTGLDDGAGRGRAHLGRLRRELITIPGRLTRHGRRLTLRLPPGVEALARALTRLRQLPAPTRHPA